MTQKLCHSYERLIMLPLTFLAEVLNKDIKSRPVASFSIAEDFKTKMENEHLWKKKRQVVDPERC